MAKFGLLVRHEPLTGLDDVSHHSLLFGDFYTTKKKEGGRDTGLAGQKTAIRARKRPNLIANLGTMPSAFEARNLCQGSSTSFLRGP